MHILLAILGAIGTIVFFVIRANQLNRAGRELAETAGDVKKFVRRSRWQSKTKTDPIKDIRDPRLAAAVMMYAIAKSDGDVTERQRSSILEQLRDGLGMDYEEAGEILGQARWLTQDLHDVTTILRRAAAPVEASCTVEECRDLIEILEHVAGVEGGMTDAQKNSLDGLRRRLCLEK